MHKFCLWTQPFGDVLKGTSYSQEILDRKGQLLRLSLASDETYRLFTPIHEISPLLIEGTLLFEDQYFDYHFGINPISLVRAIWITYIKKSRRVGASTITMQLARKLYGQSTRSISGKIWQILQAFKLEFLYSKKQILEAYLNIAPYGYNIEGVGAASRIFFNRDVSQLTLIEALTLAVIPQSPYQRTRHVMVHKKNNQDLKKVRKELFKDWVKKDSNWESKREQFDLDLEMRPPTDLPFLAPHLTTQLLLDSDRGRIKTSLDHSLQLVFETLTSQYLNSQKSLGIENASVILVDTNTMEALTYVGSAQFSNVDILGQVNGLIARRSPGSALKPFVYGLALDQGLIHPLTMIKDTPTPFGTYTPDNFDHDFAGPLSATDALVLSRNIPALDLASQIHEPDLHGFLQKAQIPVEADPLYYGLSIVLGSAEVSMIELVGLYGSLNNDGQWRSVKTLLQKGGKESSVPLLSPEASFLVLDMLSHNSQPDMDSVNRLRRHQQSVAWKTGTSVGYRDAWAIGVFDHYALGVWVGNFSGKGNNEFVGRKAAGPLLFHLIDSLAELKSIPLQKKTPSLSLNLESVEFCSLSGALPSKACPHRKQGWFIPGVSPIAHCDIHRSVPVDPISGMQVCPKFEGPSKMESFEYWPSDVLQLFAEAGIGRRIPPPMHPDCQSVAFGDIPPKIISPQKNVEYSLRSKGTGTVDIPLRALADGNIRTLTWYVDNRRLGTSKVLSPFLWKAVAGQHRVRVVDDHGRSSEIFFEVSRVD